MEAEELQFAQPEGFSGAEGGRPGDLVQEVQMDKETFRGCSRQLV